MSVSRLSFASAGLLLVTLGVLASACGRTAMSEFTRTSAAAAGGGGSDVGGAAGAGGASGTGGNGGVGGSASGQGGGTGACVAAVECDDADVCTTDSCVGGTCVHSAKDADADGAVDLACGGDDCNDLNPNARPGAVEACTDAADNDCNGVADCFDPACAAAVTCGCVPTGPEDCTNGIDEDCDTTVDCNDADCVGTKACGCAAAETQCGDGKDEDCDGNTDCADTECFGNPLCACKVAVEDCGNGTDDDCDLLIDCADPNCKGVAGCACKPPGIPETCANGADDDCDGKVDCADPECLAKPACKACTPEVCDNGKDDDCDGVLDCADDACALAGPCKATPELCNNALDDDHDGATDCDDADCKNNPVCISTKSNCLTALTVTASGTFKGNTTGFTSKTTGTCGGSAGEAVFAITLSAPSRVHVDSKGTAFDSVLYVRAGSCGEGRELACDDDSAGSKWAAAIDFDILYPGTYFVFLDGFTVDPMFGANEGAYTLHVEIEPNPKESDAARCKDAKDNDGDVYVDCADANCVAFDGCGTCNGGGPGAPEFGVSSCTNGLDDDCDGATDALDADCNASPYASVLEDCDGKDQNDNGIPDDFSCRCASDADCASVPGFICYTHTIRACGPPCNKFFGNVCPSIAAGSSCNQATGQCEF